MVAVGKSLFSSSPGPIFLDRVDCEGTESRLSECFDRSFLGIHSCRDSSGHAGVLCPCELLDVIQYTVQRETFEGENFRNLVAKQKKLSQIACPAVQMVTAHKIRGENFRGRLRNREKCKGFLPLKFPAIR